MALPLNPPVNLDAKTKSDTKIMLYWANAAFYNNVNIYRNTEAAGWVKIDTIDGDLESYEDTGLTAEEESCYRVTGETLEPEEESGDSNIDCATTFAELAAPTLVVATPISDTEIEITFKDNAEIEDNFRVERKLDAGAWGHVVDLEPNRDFFRDQSHVLMVAAGGYVPCVASDIGKQVKDDANEIGRLLTYDNATRRWTIDSSTIIANASVMAITDGTGAGTANGDSVGIIADSLYTYQVRTEKAGPMVSDWAASAQVTTFDVPSAPVLAAIPDADTQDKSIRIRWPGVIEELWKTATIYHVNDWVTNDGISYICILEHTSNAAKEPGIGINWITNWQVVTGYKIEQDKNAEGYVEIATIGARITDFLATDLTPGATYSFKILAYNAAGDSGYSNIVSKDALSAYVPTEFEKWIRDPSIEPVYLVEIYTKMDLEGFTLHAGGPTWRKTIDADDRGIDILEVWEDGGAYTEAALVAGQLPAVENFYFDYDARILYIRTSDDTDPDPEVSDFLIEGAFWLYFSNHKNIEFTVNGRLNHYPNYLAKEDIPDITQEIKPYFEGSFSISSGSIAFKNSAGFFDKKYVNYTWENSKVVLKAGKNDFSYAEFETILTSLVDKKSCNDMKITFTLRDPRQEMERNLMLTKFALEDYPDIEEDFIGESIPLCFGTKYRVVPVPINVADRKYKFHDGRSKNVQAVYKNWSPENNTPLTENTHYFVDLQRSIITFERDTFALGEEDIVAVTFTGTVNSADESISNGAEIFKHIMNNHYVLLNSELDLDSIYESKYEKTDVLSIYLYKDTPYRMIVRAIEHSMEAFTFQDAEGRLGLRSQLVVAESKAKYIANHQIFNHLQSKSRGSLFWKVNVYYNENPQTQQWEVKSAQDDNIPIRYKIWNELDIYSYFSAPSSAQTLATNIKDLLNKETIENTVPMLLFDVMAGDIIRFSRDRFYSSAGKIYEGSEIDLRIIKISKSPPSGQTTIITEIV